MHKKYVMKGISLCGITIFLSALVCKRIGTTIVLVCPFCSASLPCSACFGFFLMKNKLMSIIWLRDTGLFEWVPVLPDYRESRVWWSFGDQFTQHQRNSLFHWSSD